MTTKTFDTDLRYIEGYLPTPRSRKLRYREMTAPVQVDVQIITEEQAPIVAYVEEYTFNGRATGYTKRKLAYRYYNGQFYRREKREKNTDALRFQNYNGLQVDIDWHARKLEGYASEDGAYHQAGRRITTPKDFDDFQSRFDKLNALSDEYLILNREVWHQTNEPMYYFDTFGLGHNHGGTSLDITTHYNTNLPSANYFSALQYDQALQTTLDVASNRGDTDSLEQIKEAPQIIIVDDSAFTANPQTWNEPGNNVLNSLNNITNNTPDALTAGLLAITQTTGDNHDI